MLWLLLGIEMVEIAEEFVEAVHRRHEFVAVSEVVLSELAGHVAHLAQQCCKRRILGRHAFG